MSITSPVHQGRNSLGLIALDVPIRQVSAPRSLFAEQTTERLRHTRACRGAFSLTVPARNLEDRLYSVLCSCTITPPSHGR